jgi:iron complex outermembrane recepter protein
MKKLFRCNRVVALCMAGALGVLPYVSQAESSSSSPDTSGQLNEILVTAEKRSEKLQDVPASVSAIGGDRLDLLQVNSLADLADYIPGMAVISGGAPGSRAIVLRGLSLGYNNPTTPSLVGTYVDDLPVGDSSAGARGSQYGLDLNPYDIDHIEVLKGPQGTLYGSNTMGGLIKYSLRQPNLNETEAQVGATTEDIDHSGRLGYSLRGAVSTPIVADTLALRISGFYNDNAGYIDNIVLGTKDVNSSKEYGGMATLLWQVTDQLSMHASAVVQDVHAAGLTAVTLNGSTLQPLYAPFTSDSQFPQPFDQETRVYSFGLNWNLGFATLTSSTGWSRIQKTLEQDLSVPFVSYCAPGLITAAGCPDYQEVAYAPFFLTDESSKFVEEARLTSPDSQRVQWMLGGYFTKESDEDTQFWPTTTAEHAQLPPEDNLSLYRALTDYKEAAIFANITYKLNERFDVSGGVRHSLITGHTCTNEDSGLFNNGVTVCNGLPWAGINLWMANARFHLNQDQMFYARFATGYRPGSGCELCGVPALGIPGIVNPDRTLNYEVGYKGEFLDHKLQLDVSAFHILWDDIQLNLEKAGFTYPGNGGTASSDGIEVTAAYRVFEDLLLNATLGYTNARLTQDAPAAFGISGDQLPGSPRWTSSLTADYKLPLDATKALLLGASYRYRDGVVNQFAHTPFSQGGPLAIGPQSLVDLYAGLAIQKITLRLYGKNVFNKDSYSGVIFVNDPDKPQFVPIQPRTIGLSMDYKF